MRNLLNPKWLFIINTLPVIILFVFFCGQFHTIHTLLDEDNIRIWKCFGLVLGLLGVLSMVYAIRLMVKKQTIHLFYGFFALLAYIPFLYLYSFYFEKLIPFSIPRWMIPENIFLYAGTLLMPTLVYALFILVIHFTSETKKHKAWVNFLIAISVPLAGYLFSQLILPLWRTIGADFDLHAFLILIIIATLVFLFFLIRGLLILMSKKTAVLKEYQLLWKIPVTIVFPILGLLVNNGYLFNEYHFHHSGIFGDFSHFWFYILVLVNGLLLCLPDLNNKFYRLFLFVGRNVTFAYTCYFFLVFLPFLPLSIIAIVLFGIGFLMLAPLLIFVIQIRELSDDFAFLKTFFSKKTLLGISMLGFCVIPACITGSYLNDKHVLNEALAYLYSPDYSKSYFINKKSLQKTLDVISDHKHDNRDGIFGYRQPYLSSYFNWLVLDNLTLSEIKMNDVKRIFFGEESFRPNAEDIRNDRVEITGITTNTVYAPSQKAWKTWVNLEITNKNENSFFSEYATTIELPEGCWISDYYLYVGDRKEPGILAEKKSAMWVFSQIRNENRDPGILYYLSGNRVAFRVFPFVKDEVRKTGIEFLHKEPVELMFDGYTVKLGDSHQATIGNSAPVVVKSLNAEAENGEDKLFVGEVVENECVVYLPADRKQSLKQVRRKPYFHFLVDVSGGKEQYITDFTERIEKVIVDYPSLSGNAQISFVNSYVNRYPLDKDWREHYSLQGFDGGFYLDRGIRSALFNAYKTQSRPVIVVVTNDSLKMPLAKDFSDFRFAFPESDLFFRLSANGYLQAHSLVNNPAIPLPDSVSYSFDQTVLEYKLPDQSTVYLPDDDRPGIVLKKEVFSITESEIREKNWQSGLIMQARWMSQVLHPETSDREWLNLVKYSFLSRIMTPVTSYLVVENEAQKAMLRKKQEQVLSGNRSLDLDESTQRMSEPAFLLLFILFGFIMWFRKKRKQAS